MWICLLLLSRRSFGRMVFSCPHSLFFFQGSDRLSCLAVDSCFICWREHHVFLSRALLHGPRCRPVSLIASTHLDGDAVSPIIKHGEHKIR